MILGLSERLVKDESGSPAPSSVLEPLQSQAAGRATCRVVQGATQTSDVDRQGAAEAAFYRFGRIRSLSIILSMSGRAWQDRFAALCGFESSLFFQNFFRGYFFFLSNFQSIITV